MTNNNTDSKNIVSISKKILTSIPSSIPAEKINLNKLPDGYSLKVNHKAETKDSRGSIESSFRYFVE